MSLVKLQLYEHQSNQTIIDSYEADNYDKFVLINVDTSKLSGESALAVLRSIDEAVQGIEDEKIYIVVDSNADISVLGVKE